MIRQQAENKKKIEILPCSYFNRAAIGAWLTEQTKRGLFLKKGVLYFATFEQREPQEYIYYLSGRRKRVYTKGWNYIGRNFGHHTYVKSGQTVDSEHMFQQNTSKIRRFLRILLAVLFLSIPIVAIYDVVSLMRREHFRDIGILMMLPVFALFFAESIDVAVQQLPFKNRKRFGKIGRIKNIIKLSLLVCAVISYIAIHVYLVAQYQKLVADIAQTCCYEVTFVKR